MERLETLLNKQGLSLEPKQKEQFQTYYELLVEWNQKFNLTAITSKDDVAAKHFYDSVSLSFFVPLEKKQSVADIGSGAGFPSLPLKIMFPHLRVTIVDALNKRISFLKHVVNALQLDHVTCLHGRAEDIGRDVNHRDQYDVVTARAVARLNILNEICLPFVKKGGVFVAMKGSDPDDEVREAKKSFALLASRLQKTHRFVLPGEEAKRHLIVVEKIAPTPRQFPRKAGTPFKKPLT